MSGSEYFNPHMRLNLPAIYQGRPVRYYLLDRGPPTGEARHTRRTGEYQRRDLPGKALHWSLFGSSHADPELDFGCLRIRRTAQGAVRGIRAHELGQDLFELQAEILETSPQYTIGGTGLLVGLRPGIHQRSHCLVAVEIRDGDFQHRGSRRAADAAHPHPIAAGLLQLDAGKVGDA